MSRLTFASETPLTAASAARTVSTHWSQVIQLIASVTVADVGSEPGGMRTRYSGETRFPLILQNVHRYTWYFAVAAYTNTGLQSSLSSTASKTIT